MCIIVYMITEILIYKSPFLLEVLVSMGNIYITAGALIEFTED